MKIVVITAPDFLPGEAEVIVRLLDAGAWRVHVRKPAADATGTAQLLEALPAEYRSRVSLHDHHDLASALGVGGVHLNSRNPRPPAGFSGAVSRSCHSIAEVEEYGGGCDYMFLSPVFDSISKAGYMSNFSLKEIRESGVSLRNVLALGGVCPENIGRAVEAGFAGAAVLGYLWGPYESDCDAGALLGRFGRLVT